MRFASDVAGANSPTEIDLPAGPAITATLHPTELPTRAPPATATLPDPDDAGGWPVDFEASL